MFSSGGLQEDHAGSGHDAFIWQYVSARTFFVSQLWNLRLSSVVACRKVGDRARSTVKTIAWAVFTSVLTLVFVLVMVRSEN